jgi:putative endopeptidase
MYRSKSVVRYWQKEAMKITLSTIAVLLFSGLACFAQSSGVDLGAIDKSADPCQDFYKYACGNWMAHNPVPSAYGRWGRFNELMDRNEATLREILESAAKHPDGTAVDHEIGAFYGACTNETHVNDLGWKPLKAEIERINALRTVAEFPAEVARLHDQGVNVFFSFGSTPDYENAKMTIAEADQGGLGLPDREYYFRKDPKSEETRSKYVEHIAKIFELLGDSGEVAATKARAVMVFESNLATASLSRTDRRDPKRLHNSMTLPQFDSSLNQFSFDQYLTDLPLTPVDHLNVAVPAFFTNLNGLLTSTPFNDLKSYMVWQYVHSFAPYLSQAFVDENFNFYGKYLTGAQELQPRWKRCVEATDRSLGEALGQKFVERAFAGQSKEKTRQLVAAIESEMEKDINSLTWMSDETKQQALIKLRGVTNKIGYPDRWRDYSSIVVKKDDLQGDVARTREFEQRRDLNKIGRPVDRQEFHMTPPTVNAYYSPQENNINFPAGILQPPFYNNSADMAVSFGAIGSVIGHELTHGFDDQGRQFDADGNLRDWWTAKDDAEFKQRVGCISDEYSHFSPVPGVNLNGKLTLGENGADNGGVRLAYMALEQALQDGTVANKQLDAYTPEQRFFLGYAQVWCQNVRPEEARQRAYTDPHSPGQFRVDGVVQNTPEFQKAFSCSANQPMVSANACRVW